MDLAIFLQKKVKKWLSPNSHKKKLQMFFPAKWRWLLVHRANQQMMQTCSPLSLTYVSFKYHHKHHENTDIKNFFIQQLAGKVEISTMTSLFEKVPHTQP